MNSVNVRPLQLRLWAQVFFYVMDGRAASGAGMAGCVSVWHQCKGYPPARRQLCQLIVQGVVGDVDAGAQQVSVWRRPLFADDVDSPLAQVLAYALLLRLSDTFLLLITIPIPEARAASQELTSRA